MNLRKHAITSLIVALSVALLASSCANPAATPSASASAGSANTSSVEKMQLTISFNPGPYEDEFKGGVAPYLQAKGYQITYKEFTDGIQPDVALAQGQIDANVFQHTIYLNSINKKENINLVGIVLVPTPPMGLYSKKHKSLSEISDGAQVVLPNDPTNMLRALTILKNIGWITIKDNIDPLQAALSDVTSNPHHIKFMPTGSAQGPQALNDADFVAIQGNYAISSNIKLTTALKLEDMKDPYTNTVAVNSKNKDSQFAKDIVDGYHSEAFQKFIQSNAQYEGYRLPDYFSK